jgi:hypothetical protein
VNYQNSTSNVIEIGAKRDVLEIGTKRADPLKNVALKEPRKRNRPLNPDISHPIL